MLVDYVKNKKFVTENLVKYLFAHLRRMCHTLAMSNTNSSTHESFRDSFTFLWRFISKLRYFAREAACWIVWKSQRPKALDLCIHSRSCVGYAFRWEESFFWHQKAMLCRGVPRFPRRVAEILDDPKQIGAPISYKTWGCYSSYAKTFEWTFGANFIKDDT